MSAKSKCIPDTNVRQPDRARGGVAEVPDVAVAGRAGLLPAGGADGGARGRGRGAPRVAAGAGRLRRRRLQEAQHRAHRAAAVRRQPPQGAAEVTHCPVSRLYPHSERLFKTYAKNCPE